VNETMEINSYGLTHQLPRHWFKIGIQSKMRQQYIKIKEWK